MGRSNRRGRVDSYNAKRDYLRRELEYERVRLPLQIPVSIPSAYETPLQVFEDRRLFHPLGKNRPAASFQRSRHRLQVSPSSWRFKLSVPVGIRFARPKEVLVCVRRRMRRAVLHALGIAGSGAMAKPTYNWTSAISCIAKVKR